MVVVLLLLSHSASFVSSSPLLYPGRLGTWASSSSGSPGTIHAITGTVYAPARVLCEGKRGKERERERGREREREQSERVSVCWGVFFWRVFVFVVARAVF